MSEPKRRRIDNPTSQDNADDSINATLERIARLKQLVTDTLFHDTYCPIILKFFTLREALSNIPLISKYHNNLLFSHPQSVSLCRTLAINDFGTFITISPYSFLFKPKALKTPKLAIRNLYVVLPFILEVFMDDEPEKTNHRMYPGDIHSPPLCSLTQLYPSHRDHRDFIHLWKSSDIKWD